MESLNISLVEDAFIPVQLITVYKNSSDHYLESHKIISDGTSHKVGPGSPVSDDTLVELVRSLEKKVKYSNFEATILPDNLLYLCNDPGKFRLVWYICSPKRMVHFEKKIGLPPSATIIFPSTIFSYDGHRLTVMCFGDNSRPTMKTPLLRPPYLNTGNSGSVCMGTAKIAPTKNIDDLMTNVETAFFSSKFSHTSGDHVTAGDWKEDWLNACSWGTFYLSQLNESLITMKDLLK